MRRTALAVLTALVIALPARAQTGEAKPDAASGSDGWVSMFNGKDLTGWTPKIRGFPLGENHANTFRVDNGVIKVAYDGYEKFDGKFGHLFYKTAYSHYRMELEYRFVGDQCPGGPGWAYRNSGIMVHGQSAASMERNQDFPVSIEVQLLGGLSKGKRTTGNLCTPGTHVVMNGKLHKRHCTDSKSDTYRGDVWVKAAIEVRGNDSVKHFINGKLVLQYTKPQLDPGDRIARKLLARNGGEKMLSSGSISLQAESHGCEFRNLRIKKLENKAK